MFGYETKVTEQINEKREEELSLQMNKYHYRIFNTVYKYVFSSLDPLLRLIANH